MREYDLVVVGFGLSGAVASVESAELGARTLVIDAGGVDTAGGNSLIGGQGFISTSDVEAFAQYMSAIGARLAQPFKWAEAVALVPTRLRELGIPLRLAESGGDFAEAPGSDAVHRWRPCEGFVTPVVRVVQRRATSLGVDVLLRARVTALERDSNRAIKVRVRHSSHTKTIRARYGVILATGGYAASRRFGAVASLGTPFARGDAIALARQLGAIPENARNFSGAYYGFHLPRTPTAVTPWPLYAIRPGEITRDYPRLISRRSGSTVTPPTSKHHGLRLDPDGRYRRAAFEHSVLLLTDEQLARGPLIDSWPDGHAEGWGRRFGRKWSNCHETEIALGWLVPLSALQRDALCIKGVKDVYGIRVGPVVLNSLGGLWCDSSYSVLGRAGAIRGLYAVGELSSCFRGYYQGSGNLTECVVSGSAAVKAALK